MNREHTNSRMITNSKLKISDEFLKILQDNAFNGMDGWDVIDHIAKVQAKLVLLKELLAACLASTTNSSAEKITDGRNHTAYPRVWDTTYPRVWDMAY
ncbi:hypothetical protein Tco_1335572 [Tanacetum coccineum]